MSRSDKNDGQHGRIVNQVDDRIRAQAIQRAQYELAHVERWQFLHVSVVRRQLVTQAAKPTRVAVGRLLAQLADLADQRLDLLLLLKNCLVELFHQVFGEAGLDF